MAEPQRSIELLDELVALGFTDEAFARLHHFRLRGRQDTISAHRRYCQKTGLFQSDSQNAGVQRRLELVLSAYQKGGFVSGRPDVFIALADAAFHELPPAP